MEVEVICPSCNNKEIVQSNKSERYHCSKCKNRFRYTVKGTSTEDHKTKVLIREIENLRKQEKQSQTIQDLVADTISKSVTRLPQYYPAKTVNLIKRYREQIAVLEFSDLQIGSLVESEQTGGLCTYNKNELRKRLDRLTKSVYEITQIERNGGIPLKKLKIHCLGDIVQGEDVFPGQGFKLDTLLMEQVFTLSDEVIRRVFIPLAELFEQVEIFCIPGNHGKQGRRGQSSRQTNWDYIVYWLWRERMAETKHVKFFISASPFLIYEMYPQGQKHALIHGQQARGWLGFPYYGIDRLHKRLISLTGLYIDYLHHGHHHQPSLQDTHIGRKIGNGSIEGGSDYSVNDLITANTPQQFFFGINERGMTWEYWIRLAEYPKLKPNEYGIYTTLMFEPSTKAKEKAND